MNTKLIIVVSLAMVLAGCATTKNNGAQSQQLHERISSLEDELQRKNQVISDLEQDLERMSSLPQGQAFSSKLSTKQIQAALKKAGFYNGPLDGKVGVKTKEAIKAFQKANGLKADGIVGRSTQSELRRYLNL